MLLNANQNRPPRWKQMAESEYVVDPGHISPKHLVLPCVQNRGTSLDGGCSDPPVVWWETHWNHEKDNPLQIQMIASTEQSGTCSLLGHSIASQDAQPSECKFCRFSPQHATSGRICFW